MEIKLQLGVGDLARNLGVEIRKIWILVLALQLPSDLEESLFPGILVSSVIK